MDWDKFWLDLRFLPSNLRVSAELKGMALGLGGRMCSILACISSVTLNYILLSPKGISRNLDERAANVPRILLTALQDT